MAQEPVLTFDGAQPSQTYTAVMLDLPVTVDLTQPSSITLASKMAYLSCLQTSLRVTGNGSMSLSTNDEPVVPLGTPETTSTDPHLIVALLFGNPSNFTLARKLERQLRDLRTREESRAKFNFVDFLLRARLGSLVAAN